MNNGLKIIVRSIHLQIKLSNINLNLNQCIQLYLLYVTQNKEFYEQELPIKCYQSIQLFQSVVF
jgi:hypothetical protein